MKKLLFLLFVWALPIFAQNVGLPNDAPQLPSNLYTTPGGIPSSPTSSTANPSSANGVDPTQAPYNVKADVTKTGNDGTTTNTQNSFSSTAQSCSSTDVGKLIIVINPSTGAYPFGVGLQTVSACSGTSWTVSTTANASLAGNAVWAIGSSGNGAGFLSAYKAAVAANQTLFLPCGVMIIDTPPFFIPDATKISYLTNTMNLQGCNSAQGTRFILHPNFGLGNPNPLRFASFNLANPATGSFTFPGDTTDAKVSNLFITSMGGAIPCAAGQQIQMFNNYNNYTNIHINAMGFSASTCTFTAINTPGETEATYLDFQFNSTSLASQPTEYGLQISGQGQNVVSNSIFAFAPMIALRCGNGTGTNCTFANNYVTQVTTGVTTSTAGGFITVTGNQMTVNTQCISDGGVQTTFYVFGNSHCGGNSANQASISLTSSSSIMDISGTNVDNTTSGYAFTGTGTINDRAGNTYNGPLTQFTGTYIPVGGGSMATQFTSATTNIGSALGAQTLVATVFYKTTLNVRIGARQVTAGVGCGAGTNTATPTLAWTAPSGTSETQAVTALSVSANGAVDSGATAYQVFTLPVEANTSVTFTTASTLASAGCSTTPQYVVEAAIF